MVQPLTTATFKSTVLDADRPVLVAFRADWCGPCNSQRPILDRLARANGSAALVASVDVEANHELAHLFHVRAVPTLLLFSQGQIARRFSGLTDETTLQRAVDALVGI